MPRNRFQDPTILYTDKGCPYIRPWVDVVTRDGIARRKKTINLGPAGMLLREQQARKRMVMETINRASYVLQSQISFKELVDDYEKRHIEKLGFSTQGKYQSHLKNHIRPAFERFELHEITTRRIDDWLSEKAKPVTGDHPKAGLSWSTRMDIRNILSGIFEFARAQKLYVDDNPVEGVKLERKRLVRQKRKLSDEQTRQLLAKLPADVRLLCSVALFCTLRVSECLGLCEKHLNFEEGTIQVEQRFYRGNLDVVKGDKSNRVVPMGYLYEDLRALCLGNPDRFVFRIATRPGWGKRNSECRDDRDIQQHFIRPAAQALGFYWPGFGMHSLRREAVTSLSAALGVNQAMTLAGHSTADMSLAYTLADRKAQDAAVRARQEKILGKPEGQVC